MLYARLVSDLKTLSLEAEGVHELKHALTVEICVSIFL